MASAFLLREAIRHISILIVSARCVVLCA